MVGRYTVEEMVNIMSEETGFSKTKVVAMCIQECFMSGVDLTLTADVLYTRVDISKVSRWSRRDDPHVRK